MCGKWCQVFYNFRLLFHLVCFTVNVFCLLSQYEVMAQLTLGLDYCDFYALDMGMGYLIPPTCAVILRIDNGETPTTICAAKPAAVIFNS